MQNGLRDAYALQHPLGKLAQLHLRGSEFNPLQDMADFMDVLWPETPESWP